MSDDNEPQDTGIDFESDQSIIQHTTLVRGPKGTVGFSLVLPDGHEMTHPPMTQEEAKSVVRKWCDAARDVWKEREAMVETGRRRRRAEREQALRDEDVVSEREQELRAKLPQSLRDADEQMEARRLPGAGKPFKAAPQEAPTSPPRREEALDEMAFAQQQLDYWTTRAEELRHATTKQKQWTIIVDTLLQQVD